jgi:GxxExxY protein
MTREELNKLSNKIIGVAIEVHKKLGPGFAEKIYQKVLESELKKSGLTVEREKKITIKWEGREIGHQVVDFLINREIIVEIKVASMLNELHQAQLLSYLKAEDKRLGLLLNFGEGVLKAKRVVNHF